MTITEFKTAQLKAEQEKTLEKYRQLNQIAQKGKIVLAGSSLMEFFPVCEMLTSMGKPLLVYNRGISGYVSSQLLQNIHVQILDLAPSKLFINIGTNDIGRGIADELWDNYGQILRTVQQTCPQCRIYLMAYYPCNDLDSFGASEEERETRFAHRNPATLEAANKRLQGLAASLNCRYIDVNDGLFDTRGRLRAEYSIDGVHMNPNGYIPVLQNLLPYLEEL